MTLYFDYRVNVGDLAQNATFTAVEWHPQQPLLSVAVYSYDKGGAVFLCDELGERLGDVEPSVHPTSQVSCLSWHPSRRTLAIAWKSGELRLWNGDSDYSLAPTTKPAHILAAKWSHQGTKFITIDADGEVGGWRLDARGGLASLFTVKLETGRATCLEMRPARTGGLDMAGLAKRAVAGDERALDMFSAWRPRTAGRRTALPTQDVTAFFIASDTGSVYHVSESGSKREVLSSLGNVTALLHHDTEDYLMVVVEGLNMNYYSVDSTGGLTEFSKVKLSGGSGCGESRSLSWAGPGLLACAVGDLTVRFWEPASGNTYSILLSRQETTHTETIVTLAFSTHKGLLCGCTNTGGIVIWKMRGDGEGAVSYDKWEPVASTKVKQPVLSASWGISHLAVNATETVYVLKEQPISAAYYSKTSVVQTSASQMSVCMEGQCCELNTDVQALGIALHKEVIAVWSGKVVAVYHLDLISSISVIGSFQCECVSAGVWEDSLVVLTVGGKLQVLTLQGTLRQSLETDGQPITMSLTHRYITISTITGLLQIWDVSRREARAHTKTKDLIESVNDFGEVITALCNISGTKVGFTVAGSNLSPTPTVYVWCVDTDNVQSYTFQSNNDPARFVTNLRWDVEEPQLLVCEARRPTSANTTSRRMSTLPSSCQPSSPVILSSFLSSSEHGLLLRDSLPMDEEFVSLLAVDLPYFIIIKKSLSQQKVLAERVVMRDFEGLEECDSAIKAAVISFSFSLSIGDIDQAFKSIRIIKRAAVWKSLARMCVTSGRLDVGEVCLGQMGDSSGVGALKKARREGEEETARLALLAIRLHMIPEAVKIYEESGRYDLLNKLYQRKGEWDKAIEIAQKHDRIHLNNTYHRYARYLESQNDIKGATEMYLKADTHRHEVPRMLLQDSVALEKYIVNSKDPILLKWWAQYMESTGQMDTAMKFYEEAGDTFSMVRVLCFLKEADKAALLAETTGDRSACNHMARHLEHSGCIPEAVRFYTMATAYNNAIRLCKEQGLEEPLWGLALSSGPRQQVEAARYLEVSMPERSVVLYHKAGSLQRALDLAFRHNLYDAVEMIAGEVSSEHDTDRELLVRCSQYFLDRQHYEKAVHLLALVGEYEKALSYCWEHNVLLTEELAEALTPPEDHPEKSGLLERLGDCALSQANYHIATKKYTQAGNKMKAMKALLKSGDTEKIIFFANVSRQREMYVMAANYLQSLDWRVNPELLKNIITFYTKGKAPHLLANFYIACAQVEVDDYRNYNKALGALNEAAKILTNSDKYSNIKETIDRKIALVNKFLDATRQLERSETDTGLELCRTLLSCTDGELVRKGDILALMIESCVRTGDLTTAKGLLHDLRNAHPKEAVHFYLTEDILKRLGLEVSPNKDILGNKSLDEEDQVIDETISS